MLSVRAVYLTCFVGVAALGPHGSVRGDGAPLPKPSADARLTLAGVCFAGEPASSQRPPSPDPLRGGRSHSLGSQNGQRPCAVPEARNPGTEPWARAGRAGVFPSASRLPLSHLLLPASRSPACPRPAALLVGAGGALLLRSSRSSGLQGLTCYCNTLFPSPAGAQCPVSAACLWPSTALQAPDR